MALMKTLGQELDEMEDLLWRYPTDSDGLLFRNSLQRLLRMFQAHLKAENESIGIRSAELRNRLVRAYLEGADDNSSTYTLSCDELVCIAHEKFQEGAIKEWWATPQEKPHCSGYWWARRRPSGDYRMLRVEHNLERAWIESEQHRLQTPDRSEYSQLILVSVTAFYDYLYAPGPPE